MVFRKVTPFVFAVLVVFAGCVNDGATTNPLPPSSSVAANLIGSGPFGLHPVAGANPKSAGLSSANFLAPELMETLAAQGSVPLENPTPVTLASGGSITISHYGYVANGPLLPAPGDLPSSEHLVEASKTEPDKNAYLVLYGQTGADPTYDYGTHFLYQGHEAGPAGYITRINLDADAPHRVTLLAAKDAKGAPLATIDGVTWDPFAQRLIFTTENASGPEYQATLGFPSLVEDISGAIGRGGYEGVQNDSAGNLWIVEDVGGAVATATPHAKVPNSFIYRFVPRRRDDLTRGKLEVLQVISSSSGTPIAFHDATTDTLSPDVASLHSYGQVFQTKWITIHDTDTDGNAPFSANALAKVKLGTPFKRPENGAFRPGSAFKEFYFSETGDTNALTEAGAAFGGFGGAFKLEQTSPAADSGKLSLLYLGDVKHSGFDNCTFLSRNQLAFAEDAGDTLHTQRNALDAVWILDVTVDYGNPANQPAMLLAEGRDASATLDSGFSGMVGYQNEGDNEVTGLHMSNGDPSADGILGATVPRAFHAGWRLFYTQQHGDNMTWEIFLNPSAPSLLPD